MGKMENVEIIDYNCAKNWHDLTKKQILISAGSQIDIVWRKPVKLSSSAVYDKLKA